MFAPRHLTGGSSLHWGNTRVLGVEWVLDMGSRDAEPFARKEGHKVSGLSQRSYATLLSFGKPRKNLPIVESFKSPLCNFCKNDFREFSVFADSQFDHLGAPRKARPRSASPGSVEPPLASQSVRTTIPRAVPDKFGTMAASRYNLPMTHDDEIQRLTEQWDEQLLDDERMRKLPDWLNRNLRSSHALTRARQARPSGRRLRRSATL